MNFSEQDLISLFIKDNAAFSLFPFREHKISFEKKYKTPFLGKELNCVSEYLLPNGQRIDLLVRSSKSQRLFWIIEFKVTASPGAIIQLCEYEDELNKQIQQKTKIFKIKKSLAAQFYNEETLFFAEHMNIQCIQIAPLNKSKAIINDDIGFY